MKNILRNFKNFIHNVLKFEIYIYIWKKNSENFANFDFYKKDTNKKLHEKNFR